jgi:hypothetical protein
LATLQSQPVVITGLTPVMAAASAGGDDFQPGDNFALLVRNADTTPATVTVVVPGSEYGQPRPDVPVVVPATTGLVLIGPFTGDLKGTNRRVGVTYSKVTALTVALVAL